MSPRDQIDAATWDALRAVETLRRLASAAQTVDEALLVHDRLAQVEHAVDGAIDVALTTADARCGAQETTTR